MSEEQCKHAGECYEVNLGGQHFDPKRKITDDLNKLPNGPEEKGCNKWGDSSSEINTLWVPYNPDTDNPTKAKWEAGCSNPNHQTEEDCNKGRGKWTWNSDDGKDPYFWGGKQHCAGMTIKGKAPPPADFFVTKLIDNDHFSLYTCDGQPADGSVTMGFNPDECDEVGEMACTSSIIPQSASTFHFIN